MRFPAAGAVVAAAAAAMLAMGLWGLARGSLWRDESVTYDAAGRSVGQLWAMAHHVDAVHAVYYLLMHVLVGRGAGEVALRTPSVLAMTAAAGLVAALGARLVRPRAGLTAGLVFAATPFVSMYAQEGRSYALVCACVLLSTYCLVRALDTQGRRWWAGYAAAISLAALLHEFAVLALLAHAVTLVLCRVPRRAWRYWGAGAACCAVLLAPLAVVSVSQTRQVGWLRSPGWGEVGDLALRFAGPDPVVAAVLGVLALVALVRPVCRPGTPDLRAVAAPLLVLPPAVLLTVSLVHPLYYDRYVLFALPGLPLLAASGLERVAGGLRRLTAGRRTPSLLLPWVLGAALAAGVFVPQLPQQRFLRTPAARTDDLAAAARIVERGSRPGDAVIFSPSGFRAAKLAYPQDFRRVADIALARTPVQAANLRGLELSRRKVRRAMLRRERVWVVSRPGYHLRGHEKGALNEQATLRRHFRLVSDTQVYGVDVRLYVRRDAS